jgi:predicted acylesterase/phospholipase RssA
LGTGIPITAIAAEQGGVQGMIVAGGDRRRQLRLLAQAVTHPVAAALRERPVRAAFAVALVVEGGGMRGAVSGGMALGLDELGLAGAFDAAYGSSAGTLNAMWLVSGACATASRRGPTRSSWRADLAPAGAAAARAGGRRARAGGGALRAALAGLFDAVLAGRTELHPIATDVETAEAVDLHDSIRDSRSLRLALRASAALPSCPVPR